MRERKAAPVHRHHQPENQVPHLHQAVHQQRVPVSLQLQLEVVVLVLQVHRQQAVQAKLQQVVAVVVQQPLVNLQQLRHRLKTITTEQCPPLQLRRPRPPRQLLAQVLTLMDMEEATTISLCTTTCL